MAAAPSAEWDEAALGGTFMMDQMAGVLRAGVFGTLDDGMVQDLAFLVHCVGPCCHVASFAVCSALSNVIVHRRQCSSTVKP